MCGRYALTATMEDLKERYKIQEDAYSYEEREEIYPTNDSPIVLPNRQLAFVKWGFTPSFSKKPLINARAETILEKATFSKPFKQQRCLIPATYFYEWEKVGSKKQKHSIAVEEQPIFSMAGICETYADEEGNAILTYVIITTEANEQMASIHHRMPVVLKKEDETRYLDTSADPEEMQKLLVPLKGKLSIQ